MFFEIRPETRLTTTVSAATASPAFTGKHRTSAESRPSSEREVFTDDDEAVGPSETSSKFWTPELDRRMVIYREVDRG